MAYNHENIIVGAADVYLGARDVETGETAKLPGYVPAGPEGSPAEVPYEFTANKSARATFEPTPGTYAEGWTGVGLTTGGVEFAYAPDFGEVEVDQYLDVAKMFKQRQTVTVNTTFAEATLENLLFAWGRPLSDRENGAGDNAGDEVVTIAGGALGDKPEERSLAFVGPAPGANRERVYYLARVLSVESSSHSMSRSEATTIPVALRCLPAQNDTSGEVEYGKIIERATTA